VVGWWRVVGGGGVGVNWVCGVVGWGLVGVGATKSVWVVVGGVGWMAGVF